MAVFPSPEISSRNGMATPFCTTVADQRPSRLSAGAAIATAPMPNAKAAKPVTRFERFLIVFASFLMLPFVLPLLRLLQKLFPFFRQAWLRGHKNLKHRP